MNIYILTLSEYSDYSIHSVYSTREKAEEALKKYKNGSWAAAQVEEWPLDVYLYSDDTHYGKIVAE